MMGLRGHSILLAGLAALPATVVAAEPASQAENLQGAEMFDSICLAAGTDEVVFADRFHAEYLTTPRQVRNAMA